MAYIREETVGRFTKEELLQLVKNNLDELGIPYEEKPGGFGPGRLLDPDVFQSVERTETLTLGPRVRDQFTYRPKGLRDCRRTRPGCAWAENDRREGAQQWKGDGQAFEAA